MILPQGQGCAKQPTTSKTANDHLPPHCRTETRRRALHADRQHIACIVPRAPDRVFGSCQSHGLRVSPTLIPARLATARTGSHSQKK